MSVKFWLRPSVVFLVFFVVSLVNSQEPTTEEPHVSPTTTATEKPGDEPVSSSTQQSSTFPPLVHNSENNNNNKDDEVKTPEKPAGVTTPQPAKEKATSAPSSKEGKSKGAGSLAQSSVGLVLVSALVISTLYYH